MGFQGTPNLLAFFFLGPFKDLPECKLKAARWLEEVKIHAYMLTHLTYGKNYPAGQFFSIANEKCDSAYRICCLLINPT